MVVYLKQCMHVCSQLYRALPSMYTNIFMLCIMHGCEAIPCNWDSKRQTCFVVVHNMVVVVVVAVFDVPVFVMCVCVGLSFRFSFSVSVFGICAVCECWWCCCDACTAHICVSVDIHVQYCLLVLEIFHQTIRAMFRIRMSLFLSYLCV